ncbi:MAG: hypothetical protein EAZ74_00965 [Alphaproteobacteria bacterium]|nr:MAG: hypothetical protein EAZ74_00965 [Alphaproteobacteria bacterium]TAF75295.1 MAG: hypothetical protein EAZ52_07030 [Alphaproteobacteria bacterium]
MGQKKIIVNQLADNIAEAWCEEDGRQFGQHKIYGGAFSDGENIVESVQEIKGINGHVGFEIRLDGSPETVLTDHLYEGKGMKNQQGRQGDVIDFYRS